MGNNRSTSVAKQLGVRQQLSAVKNAVLEYGEVKANKQQEKKSVGCLTNIYQQNNWQFSLTINNIILCYDIAYLVVFKTLKANPYGLNLLSSSPRKLSHYC